MSVCHHGRHINDSWMECPKCRAESDLRDAADAAQDNLAESRRQTTILENIASRGAVTANEDVAQKKAIFAANRHAMGDLRGAVQLISDAIELDPDFLSFYLQRAKYSCQQGRRTAAIADLRHLFEKDPGILAECEARPAEGHPDEHAGIRAEIEVAIENLTEAARRAATASMTSAQREVERMREAFREVPWPEFVTAVDEEYQRLAAAVKSGSYRTLVDIPRLARRNAAAASAAISKSPGDIERQRRDELIKATSGALDSITMTYARESAAADILYDEARHLVELSRNELAARSLDALQRALELAGQAAAKGAAAEAVGRDARIQRLEAERSEEERLRQLRAAKAGFETVLATIAAFLVTAAVLGGLSYACFHVGEGSAERSWDTWARSSNSARLGGSILGLLKGLFGIACGIATPIAPFFAAGWAKDSMRERAKRLEQQSGRIGNRT